MTSVKKRAASIAKQFGIRPKRIVALKQPGVYRITLQNGTTLGMKRMPVSLKSLRWMDRALGQTRSNGFKRIAWRDPNTADGSRLYVMKGGAPYILTPWFHGRWPSPQSASDMKKCGITLAQFHQAAPQPSRIKSGAKNRIGIWGKHFRTQRSWIVQMGNKAARKNTAANLFLKRSTPVIAGYVDDALTLLRRYKYQSVCRNRTDLMVLCHGDGGPTNFIFNNNGAHLIDFETLCLDLRAYDLFRVIYNSCKDHNWKFSIAQHFLDGYQSVQPLNKKDFEMLQALLRFPRSCYLLLGRYRRLNKPIDSTLVKQLKHALKAEQKVTVFIAKLRQYAEKMKETELDSLS